MTLLPQAAQAIKQGPYVAQMFGIGTPIAGTTGAFKTGSAKSGVVSGTTIGALDNPQMKSRMEAVIGLFTTLGTALILG